MASPELATHEHQSVPEREVDPRSVGIAGTTLYKNWYPGPVQEHHIIEKVRGDLALASYTQAKDKGFQITLIEGGSSDAFRAELQARDIPFTIQEEPGMSGGRRQAFKEISGKEGVKVIVWAEPEKVSIFRDSLPEVVLPILQGQADVIVPKRDDAAFATYPDYQAAYEQKANKLWNDILKKHSLLPENAEDLDAWFGPRFFRNAPEVIKVFLDKYDFIKGDRELDKIVNPDLWPNALFLPVVAALHKKMRVMSMPVHYRHPAEQTATEINNDEMERKRDVQYKNIIVSTMHFVRGLENDPKSKLHAA